MRTSGQNTRSDLLDYGGSSMRVPPSFIQSWRISFGLLLAGCLLVGGAKPATASVMYDFSLAANGDVGAISIQLTFADFLPEGSLDVFDLTRPEVTEYSASTALDPVASAVGIEVTAATTLIGFFLTSAIGQSLLYTFEYPGDFFVLSRMPNQKGTFLSSAGTVSSDFNLVTSTPTATLVVSRVPEPATVALCGLGVLGVATWRRLRSAPA
jgi:hypothetical protein